MPNQRSLRTFWLVWGGQFVSEFSSNLTGFALGVWIFNVAGGSITQFSIANFLVDVPGLLIGPIAGVVVDRFDRRKVMFWSDLGALMTTALVAYYLMFDARGLTVMHVYICNIVASIFGAFQGPAFSASLSQLVPGKDLGRVNGFMEVGDGIVQLLCPVAASLLMSTIGIEGIIMFDFAGCIVSEIILLMVDFPPVVKSKESEDAKGTICFEAQYGWKFIRERKGLLALLITFACSNVADAFIVVLMPPLLLRLTSVEEYGIVSSVAGAGVLVGSILVATFGTPTRLVRGILLSLILQGTILILAVNEITSFNIAFASFCYMIFLPLVQASSNSLWQRHVPADLQGRVFTIRSTIAVSAIPIGQIVSGPLADYVFEPAMAEGGSLSGTLVASLVGVGPGRGICFMFILLSVFMTCTGVFAYFYPPLRALDDVSVEIQAKTPQSKPKKQKTT